MNRQELEHRLENVVNTIRTSEAELKKLREDKKHRILLLHPGELRNIGTRIRELEDQVEDNKLARGALEKEIQESKEKKEPEALKIRKRLAEELWPAALVEYEKLKRTFKHHSAGRGHEEQGYTQGPAKHHRPRIVVCAYPYGMFLGMFLDFNSSSVSSWYYGVIPLAALP